MITELDVIRLEVQVVLNLFPNNIKPLPEFNNGAQHKSWPKSTDTLIKDFKITVINCQNTLVMNIFSL